MQIFICLQKTQYSSFQLLENGTKKRKTGLFSTYMLLGRTSLAEAHWMRLKNVTYLNDSLFNAQRKNCKTKCAFYFQLFQ